MTADLLIEGTSTEYLRVLIRAAVDPTGAPVQIAFVPRRRPVTDSDWHPAEWTPGQTWTPNSDVEARILIGPGSTVPLPSGRYDTWARIDMTIETPVQCAGVVFVR